MPRLNNIPEDDGAGPSGNRAVPDDVEGHGRFTEEPESEDVEAHGPIFRQAVPGDDEDVEGHGHGTPKAIDDDDVEGHGFLGVRNSPSSRGE